MLRGRGGDSGYPLRQGSLPTSKNWLLYYITVVGKLASSTFCIVVHLWWMSMEVNIQTTMKKKNQPGKRKLKRQVAETQVISYQWHGMW